MKRSAGNVGRISNGLKKRDKAIMLIRQTRRACVKRGGAVRRRLQIKVIPVDVISPDSLVSRCAEFIESAFERFGREVCLRFDSTNCIVIWQKDVAVVVDPGGGSEEIVRFLKRRKLTVGAYWLTHAHPDHIGGLPGLLKEFPAPVRYHRADSVWLKVFKVRHPIMSKQLCPFVNVKKVECGGIVAKVILTPGHTKGGVCYLLENLGVLLSGDTLFGHGVLSETRWGGNAKDLRTSLQRLFRSVADEVKVVPGHWETTTIGMERPYHLRSARQK